MSAPDLTIVGSRLQTLALVAIGLALVVSQSDSLLVVAPICALCFLWAATIAVRLAKLGADGVSIRRIHGTKIAAVGHYEAYSDHRYLLLRFDDGSRARIEVPVEIRPQVRDWAEATSTPTLSSD